MQKLKANVINYFYNNCINQLRVVGAQPLERAIEPTIFEGMSVDTTSPVAYYFNILGEEMAGAIKFDFCETFMRFIRDFVHPEGEGLVVEKGEFESEEVEEYLLEFAANIFSITWECLKGTSDEIENDMPKILKGNLSLTYGCEKKTLLLPINSNKGIIYMKFIFE